MFHKGTKKRITVSQGAEPVDNVRKSEVKNPTKTYKDFRAAILQYIDETIISESITDPERVKMLWLRTRVELEM